MNKMTTRFIGLPNIKLLFIFFIVLVFGSCAPDNTFSFDKGSQEIKSKHFSGIKALYLENNFTQEGYEIMWTDKEHSAPRSLKINPLTKGYSVYDKDEMKIENDSFKLKPFTRYTIERADQGDAITWAIILITDKKGLVDSSYVGTAKDSRR